MTFLAMQCEQSRTQQFTGTLVASTLDPNPHKIKQIWTQVEVAKQHTAFSLTESFEVHGCPRLTSEQRNKWATTNDFENQGNYKKTVIY
jgi:hypothetical protein